MFRVSSKISGFDSSRPDRDLSLLKYIYFGETKRIQFRAECFHVFTHPNFGLPGNDLQSPAFGQIRQAASPRLLQLAINPIF